MADYRPADYRPIPIIDVVHLVAGLFANTPIHQQSI